MYDSNERVVLVNYDDSKLLWQVIRCDIVLRLNCCTICLIVVTSD